MWGGERRSISISTGKERLMSEENRKAIRISVRNLVEFVLRSGDIDNRRSGNAQKDAMLTRSRRSRFSWRDAPMESSRKTGSR